MMHLALFYENAWPFLKENKIPFLLFVSTEPVGQKGYMTWEQIKEVEKESLHLLVIIHILMIIY